MPAALCAHLATVGSSLQFACLANMQSLPKQPYATTLTHPNQIAAPHAP